MSGWVSRARCVDLFLRRKGWVGGGGGEKGKGSEKRREEKGREEKRREDRTGEIRPAFDNSPRSLPPPPFFLQITKI